MRSEQKPFSLYVHIPYCVSKCPYCDFNSHVVARIPEREYTDALLEEMDSQARSGEWSGRGLKSVFFGGGTPSTFQPGSIGAILERAASLFSFSGDIEITLEANPGTVDNSRFSGYRAAGVNRISIGAQSFRPDLLKFLGRVHSAGETRQALEMVRRAGFDNFNLDLIYAVPGQSLADLKADLAEALSFRPPHLSAYNLTIEEGTPFHREHRQGRIRGLPEEDEIAMAELIEEGLARAGLEASLAYTSERKQFGVPLKNHQAIQGLVADMITQVSAARAMCHHAARLKQAGDPALIMETSIAKYFSSRVAVQVALDAVQIHGANGCSDRYPVQRYLRDAKIMEIIEGSNQMQQIIIAKHGYQAFRFGKRAASGDAKVPSPLVGEG